MHACQALTIAECVLYATYMFDTPSTTYPRSAAIKRAIAAFAQSGLSVGSVEISPTGAVRIYAAGVAPEVAANDFDEWEKRGAL